VRTILDLHLHSKYSRATSPKMEVDTLDLWARKKGIDILATGDFTHPQYLRELKDKLIEDGSGFLHLKVVSHDSVLTTCNLQPTTFVLSGEIACIYKDKGQTRRLHICVLAPDFATVDKINATLNKYGCNLKSDGRPIIGLSAKRLAEVCFEANEKTLVIPAHAWTPWFAIFGSKSGYDSLEECYEELTPRIYAIETGLSSDPAMNWRLSQLDGITLLSNSDAHSLLNIGREANVFDMAERTYDEMAGIIKSKDKKKFLYTVEFYPQEGRYHVDGHAKCKFSCSPHDSKKKYKNICPMCKKELTLGVEHRVDDLADRALGFKPANAVPYRSLVPLQEIVAECLQQGKATKRAQALYEKMLAQKTEFEILLDSTREEIAAMSNELLAEAVMRVREGRIVVKPGYDGEYGVVKVFDEAEVKKNILKQESLL